MSKEINIHRHKSANNTYTDAHVSSNKRPNEGERKQSRGGGRWCGEDGGRGGGIEQVWVIKESARKSEKSNLHLA